MGGLVENHGPGFPPQALQMFPAAPFVDGQKPLEGKAPRGQAADRQSVYRGAAAGDGQHRHAVFHEAPHKLRPTLTDFCQLFGPDRPIALCRELTKLHEETRRCTLGEAVEYYRDHDPRGEYVLVVAGIKPEQAVTLAEGSAQVLALVESGVRLKDAVREVADHTGLGRNELYAAALEGRK